MNKQTAYLLVIIVSFSLLSCEKDNNTITDISLTTPFVISATLTKDYIHLDTSSSNSVTTLGEGRYLISDTIIAKVTDQDGFQDIKKVSFNIYRPGTSTIIASGELMADAETSTSYYSSKISFIISRSQIGPYLVETYSIDQSNLISNSYQVTLLISRNNSIPKTSNLIAPDTIRRPTVGFELVVFSVTVNDSDGLGDVNQVFFKRIFPSSGNTITMYDDGEIAIHGDSHSGDGTYSRLVQIDQSALLGEQVFLFQAKDNVGSFSDSLKHTVVINP